MPAPLEAREIHRSYEVGDGSRLEVLQGLNLRVAHGEAVSVVGTSGAGKSTLLHILGALDRPTSGEVLLAGQSLASRSSDEIAAIRNRFVGFVFQFHHLLREFTALENASLPALMAGMSVSDARDRARDILHTVGLGARLDHRPWQLSGGEQQRVAVARALANKPPLLLADEPSGNLDLKTSGALHDLLFELRDQEGVALVLVTHNLELASRADRTLELREGVLQEEAEQRSAPNLSEGSP
ncbi:MAG: ABC transporter ATP-binding protein [Gemmatimonadales bacterium]|nr:MAG: ABC transporter ATP-binding protein [Gemmatimonadales bacterium]